MNCTANTVNKLLILLNQTVKMVDVIIENIVFAARGSIALLLHTTDSRAYAQVSVCSHNVIASESVICNNHTQHVADQCL